MKPCIQRRLQAANFKAKINHDKGKKERHFKPTEDVWVRTDNENIWKPGTIIDQTHRWSYQVEVDGKHKHHHADQLRSRDAEIICKESTDTLATNVESSTQEDVYKNDESTTPEVISIEDQNTITVPVAHKTPDPPRRGERVRKQTKFYSAE